MTNCFAQTEKFLSLQNRFSVWEDISGAYKIGFVSHLRACEVFISCEVFPPLCCGHYKFLWKKFQPPRPVSCFDTMRVSLNNSSPRCSDKNHCELYPKAPQYCSVVRGRCSGTRSSAQQLPAHRDSKLFCQKKSSTSCFLTLKLIFAILKAQSHDNKNVTLAF